MEEEQEHPLLEDQLIEEDEYVDGYLHLKTNKLLKGVIELEIVFDEDVIQENKQKEHINAEEIQMINLGTWQDPKYILLGKSCIGKLREKIIKAYWEYINMIFETYDQLKTYNLGIITHTISLKLGTNSF